MGLGSRVGNNIHRKETLYKNQSAENLIHHDYLIPLEFHKVTKNESRSLNLLWNERLVLSLVLKCKLKLYSFQAVYNKNIVLIASILTISS